MTSKRSVIIAMILLIPADLAKSRDIDVETLLRRCFVVLSLSAPLDPTVLNESNAKASMQVMRSASEVAPKSGIRIMDDMSVREVALNQKIDASNIEHVFSMQYDGKQPGLYGAKGIVFQGIDGQLHLIVWSQGEGLVGNNIHHRDVTASLLLHESELMEQIGVNKEFVSMFRYSDEVKKLANKMMLSRKQSSFPLFLLERFQGIQLSARRNAEALLEISSIDLDSSLTSSLRSNKTPISAERVNLYFKTIADAIDPAYLTNTRYRYLADLNISNPENLIGPNSIAPEAIFSK